MDHGLLARGLWLTVCTASLALGACASNEERRERMLEPGTAATAGENTGGTNGGVTGGATGGATNGADTGGDDGGAANAGPGEPPPLKAGCAGQMLREGIPEDLGKPGPWPVGALTTMLGGVVTEVWYPAEVGSEAQKPQLTYPLEEHLPTMEQGKIPKDHSPVQTCNCFRDLPMDTEAGPYPVLLFVHGTAGFRTTNMENVTHWASRGFVVVSSDHPGIQLKNMLDGLGGLTGAGSADQAGDARKVLNALASPSGDIAFLKDHIDMKRVGVMGHSAGAQAVSSLGDVADVIIPYAGGAAITAARVKSVMFVTGDADAVVAPSTGGYDGTTSKPKRRAWITKGGHLVGGSLCVIRDPSDPANDIVKLADKYQIGNAFVRPAFSGLFDGCNATPDAADGKFIPESRGIAILNYVSTGQFEEALHCSSTAAAQLARTQAVFGDDVSQYEEKLP